ncbi:Acetyl-coenzyme A carboxylase carboxyl transferase subunit beta, chloroplastic [subsurface metagenome]
MPRVIKQTIGKDLPDNFGLAETNLKNGQVDMVVSRLELKEKIALLLKIFKIAKSKNDLKNDTNNK